MGRKKVKTQEKAQEKVELRLRMDADLAGRIQDAAQREDRSVSSFMRNLAIRELERREREASAIRELERREREASGR